MSGGRASPHAGEPKSHRDVSSGRLNWLRAGVLGANDGIVSTAGLVVGVAGASTDRLAILTAGVAGLAAGALSMATGEYVSVSAQRDSERAMLATERWELKNFPAAEIDELAGMYEARGVSPEISRVVAQQLTEHDALAAHAEIELRIDPDALTNPWHAAIASGLSFTIGAILPLAAILLPGPALRVPLCFAAVLAALVLTGAISARLGVARVGRAVIRTVLGGALCMTVTYGIGALVGVSL